MAASTEVAKSHVQIPSTITINVSQEVKLETLHTVIDRIAHATGCLACGLLGIDLHFRGGDPDFLNVRTLPGVQQVSFER